jgi:hypothetical protein
MWVSGFGFRISGSRVERFRVLAVCFLFKGWGLAFWFLFMGEGSGFRVKG